MGLGSYTRMAGGAWQVVPDDGELPVLNFGTEVEADAAKAALESVPDASDSSYDEGYDEGHAVGHGEGFNEGRDHVLSKVVRTQWRIATRAPGSPAPWSRDGDLFDDLAEARAALPARSAVAEHRLVKVATIELVEP